VAVDAEILAPMFDFLHAFRQLCHREPRRLAFHTTANVLLAAMYLDAPGLPCATPDITHRFRRALAAFHVLQATGAGGYKPTSAGRLLFGLPMGARNVILHLSRRRTAWFELAITLRTGLPVAKLMLGKNCWEYLAENADAAQKFYSTVKTLSTPLQEILLAGHDWSEVRTVLDVGGGRGYLLREVQRRHPQVRVILFDLPHVVAAAATDLANVTADSVKVELRAGSFLDAIPKGGDVYVLANVLHNWDDIRALRILQNCRAAAGHSSHLLIVEPVISDSRPGWFETAMDMHMLLLFQGKERTIVEHNVLLRRAGFELCTRVARVWPYTVLRTRPV
jgi:SAM-dependent methyltransferase